MTNSYGVIRFTDALVAGIPRTPAERTFATNTNTPAADLSLYRFSRGHGGLQCLACHGSTHAEFPSAFRNDNIQNQNLQGHAGVIAECDACHGNQPSNSQFRKGPHGMHPISSSWWGNHADYARQSPGVSQCKACHGANYEGTVLSRAFRDRPVSTKFGSRTYWKGYQISCYNCHDGVNSSNPTSKGFPTATGTTASTTAGVSVAIPLTASTSNLRVVSQPGLGTVGLTGTTATYYPEVGFSGTDTFTFAASNGFNDSPLVTVTVTAPDANTNGLSDWWETLNFSGPVSATADADGDGMNNAQEFQASTDPKDVRSLTRIFDLKLTNGNAAISFVPVMSKLYALESSTNLLGDWSTVTNNVWSLNRSLTLTDPGAAESQKFCRVRVLP